MPRIEPLRWLVVACVMVPSFAAAAPPARSLASLDEAFAASIADLSRRAAAAGCTPLADMITGWRPTVADGTQLVVAIPPTIEQPAGCDTPEQEAVWNDFLAARRSHAAGLFEHAMHAAAAHDRPQPRGERPIRSDPDAPPLSQQSCEAVRLVHLVLRDDPDHARAREAGGWVRRGDTWTWPETARRLDRGEAFDPAFGWMPASKLERYRRGERSDRGRWIDAADDEARDRDVKHGREYHADHWDILFTSGMADAAALAERLEETRMVWRQVFGGFAVEPAELERRIGGRGRVAVKSPHATILCSSRRQYLDELQAFEPRLGMTNGIYWTPTKTIWFFNDAAADPPEPNVTTIHHEATHQLFTESRADTERLRELAGARCGFWAIEAAACYLETIRPIPGGWLVGGREAGRAVAARERLDDGFFMPLAELTAMGRETLQADERLPQIYSQLGGLADFFMNGEGGRYREAFVEYLVRVYTGTAAPDTLSRLCRRSYADLDASYHHHLVR